MCVRVCVCVADEYSHRALTADRHTCCVGSQRFVKLSYTEGYKGSLGTGTGVVPCGGPLWWSPVPPPDGGSSYSPWRRRTRCL